MALAVKTKNKNKIGNLIDIRGSVKMEKTIYKGSRGLVGRRRVTCSRTVAPEMSLKPEESGGTGSCGRKNNCKDQQKRLEYLRGCKGNQEKEY